MFLHLCLITNSAVSKYRCSTRRNKRSSSHQETRWSLQVLVSELAATTLCLSELLRSKTWHYVHILSQPAGDISVPQKKEPALVITKFENWAGGGKLNSVTHAFLSK